MGTKKDVDVLDQMCIHGMMKDWCAICLKQDELEEPLIFKGILDKEKK